MYTWKIEIEYDGTRYRGWPVLHNERTIQGEVGSVASQLFSDRPVLVAASPTDPGVHALSQVLHLKVRELQDDITPRMIRQGFNDLLPHDINVLRVQNAEAEFHARRDAISAQYLYKISTRRTAFDKNYVWWVKKELDLESMNRAALHLVGRNDLSSFSLRDQTSDQSSKVSVKSVELIRFDDQIHVRVRASRFLWEMVRRITGALVEVGSGGLSENAFARLIKFPTNSPDKFIAPASGLFLEKIYYK